MRKLKLDPEELTVDSFATAELDALYGTVRGAQETIEPVEGEETVVETETTKSDGFLSIWTCFTKCNQLTCNLSCAGTCIGDRTCNSCLGSCRTGIGPDCCV